MSLRTRVAPVALTMFLWGSCSAASIDCKTLYREHLASDLDLDKLARTTKVIGLAEVPEVARQVLAGKVQGRTIVDVNA